MSNSVLYHTFGVLGMQYRKTDFLAARQSFTAAFTRIIWNAHTVNPVTSSSSGKSRGFSRHFLLAVERSNWLFKSPGFGVRIAESSNSLILDLPIRKNITRGHWSDLSLIFAALRPFRMWRNWQGYAGILSKISTRDICAENTNPLTLKRLGTL